MKINYILNRLNLDVVKINHVVSMITDDSKECISNSVFIACAGKKYINEAINNGAKTIITDVVGIETPFINYIYVDNPRRILALSLKIYHRDISNKLCLIGVVGTNGKTTTSTIGYSFFNSVHKDSMLIGSNGIFYQNVRMKTNNTTPKISILYHYLLKAKQVGIKYVFMEVSSIAVSELRCLGLEFKVLIYTNFSEDHLDYHKNMEAYLFAKMIPFISNRGISIINADDYYSKKLCSQISSSVITYGVKKGKYKCDDPVVTKNGFSFKYLNCVFNSKMIGSFNIYNVLAILPLCDIFNISIDKYVKFINEFTGVSGRMQRLMYKDNSIIIDYAHTEDAIKKVIYDTINFCENNFYIVVGCGGDREKENRGKIGKFLSSFKDKDIINDIVSNMEFMPTIIENRKDAIIYGLSLLGSNDCLLILGKGAEDYIDVKGVKYHYSDLEVCNEWIRAN